MAVVYPRLRICDTVKIGLHAKRLARRDDGWAASASILYGKEVCMHRVSAVLVLFCGVTAVAAAQSSSNFMPLDSGFGPLDPVAPATPVPQLIQEFAAKESQFEHALENYTYKRTVKVETLNDDGKPNGEYYEVDSVGLDSHGKHYESVLDAPPSTLSNGGVYMSESDFDDIEHRLPFVLTEQALPQYDVTYVGQQKVDQVETYVFDVRPKRIEKHQRYFQGRIWVDAKDHQIVVVDGKSVPDDLRKGQQNLSLPYITFRQQIDGKYWFPVWTHGAGTLHFAGGNGYMAQNVAMRETVTYTDYKYFGSSVKLFYKGRQTGSVGPGQPEGQQKPQKPQQKPQR